MRFRDVRANPDSAPASMLVHTTFRSPSTATRGPGRQLWFGARRQIFADLMRQQPKRSRRQRLRRKPRVGGWK